MDELHRYIGFAIPAGFLALALWAALTFISNRPPAGAFWTLLAALQGIIGVQVIVGGILYLSGERPATRGPTWLHYIYGAVFPALVLVVAHRYARRFEGVPWIVFGIAGLINAAATFRALQTGLGVA